MSDVTLLPPHSPADRFRIFLSAVTNEFEHARNALGEDLVARGLEVKIQRSFRQEHDSATTLEKLHNYIRDCSAVVCIIGQRSGDLPKGDSAAPYAHMLPPGFTQASYTQWEFHFARYYKKRLSIYIATSEFKPHDPAPTGPDFPDLQKQLIAHIRANGLDRDYIDTPDKLCRLVLREQWPDHSGTLLRPNNLPHASIGSLFKGREEFLKNIRRQLGEAMGKAAAIRPNHAILGMGGIGKTRTAIEYAWAHESDYTALLFITAASAQSFETQLAALCGVFKLAEGVTDHEVRLQAALDWLNQPDHHGWLLIVDNVDTDEAARAVESRLAALSHGHVLITGRVTQWDESVIELDLSVLDLDSAAAYLLEATEGKRRPLAEDETVARQIATDLGQLALALEMAAGYVKDNETSLADYHRRWQIADQAVISWHHGRPTGYPRPLATAWQMSVDSLPTQGARAMLNILSWLSPEPLPRFLFDAAAAPAGLQPLFDRPEAPRKLLQILTGDESADPQESLRQLRRCSLLQSAREASCEAVGQLHRVLAHITRQRLSVEDQTTTLTAALYLVDSAAVGVSGDVRHWPIWHSLAPHIRFVTDHGGAYAIAEPTGRLLNDLAQLLQATNRLGEAEPLMRRVVTINEKERGSDDPVVATCLNNLAALLQATNRQGEAEPLMRRALKIDEASYGADHPKVAICLNNLARLLQDTNLLGEAEPLMERVVSIFEKAYGENHPNVATALNNLALLLQATNRVGEAEPLMRRALAIDESSYGADHPDVARDLNNLASLLQATNRLGEAEPLMERVVSIFEKAFGENHPNVATALNNLAQLLQATNRLGEAEPLMRRALKIDEASYGPDHPEVATDLNNLAGLLQATNRLGEAEPLMRRALEIDERNYGADHPNVARDLNNLAQLLKATNRLGGGGTADEAAFGDLFEVLGQHGASASASGGGNWELCGVVAGAGADAGGNH